MINFFNKYLFFFFLFIQIESNCQIQNTIKTIDKIYGLSKVWSEIKYNFPYFKFIPNLNIDSLYQSSLIDVLQSQNDYEYYNILNKFSCSFNDNHTYIHYPNTILNYIYTYQFTTCNIFLNQIEEKAIITHVSNTNKAEIPIGSEILEVDSLPMNEYLNKNILPYVSGSSENNRKTTGITKLLMGIKGTKIMIKYKTPSGEVKNLKLIHGDNNDEWFPIEKNQSYQTIGNSSILYIKIDEFNNYVVDTLKNHLEDLKKANGFIIDLRGNGGGSSIVAGKIAQYFVKDSILIGSKVKTRKNLSLQRFYGNRISASDTIENKDFVEAFLCSKNLMLENVGIDTFKISLKSQDRIIKPTVILIDSQNASATEEFLLFLKAQKHIIFMGEQTSGGNGQPEILDLPGGGKAAICLQYCSYPDGKDYYRTGITPNIEIKQTINDLINGIDTVKEKARNYIVNLIK